MVRPIVSIVIANYNYGHFLETAIRSVLDQDAGDKVELIICDGGSTDNSIAIIQKYAKGLPPNTSMEEWQSSTEDKLISVKSNIISWWTTGKDQGQSDAFNKGFAQARGRFACWLNADDVILPGVIQKVCNYIVKHPSVEWISGGTVFCDSGLRMVKLRRGASVAGRLCRWLPLTNVGCPSTFFSLSRFREVGGFDVDLHYIMDCDLWLKLFMKGVRCHHLSCYFWGFRLHDSSKTTPYYQGAKNQKHLQEVKRWCEKYNLSEIKYFIGDKIFLIWKLLSLSLPRSIIDTAINRGRYVMELEAR